MGDKNLLDTNYTVFIIIDLLKCFIIKLIKNPAINPQMNSQVKPFTPPIPADTMTQLNIPALEKISSLTPLINIYQVPNSIMISQTDPKVSPGAPLPS